MTEIVPTPLLMRLRKLWFQVHKWIALALMVLLIPLGLSGIVLAWDDSIDHALNPQRYAVSGKATLAPSAYVAAAAAVLKPGARVTGLRYPDDDGPVVASATGGGGKHEHEHGAGDGGARHKDGGGRRGGGARTSVWLDPPTARILDQGPADAGLVRLAHNFHGSLFVPGYGRALVGLLGIAMFVMAASGIWLWWPPLGRWTRGIRWQRGDRKLDTNLHHTVGFWISLPLAAQAFTGAWIASPQLIQLVTGAGMGPTSAMGGPMRGGPPLETPRLTPDAALAAAQGNAGGGTPMSINWPGSQDGLWRVTLRTGKAPASLTVDDATGAVAAAPRRDGGGLAMAMRHYHDGTTLGFYWRMVMVLIGLSPTLLGITGLLMWLRGRRWRKRLTRTGREAERVTA